LELQKVGVRVDAVAVRLLEARLEEADLVVVMERSDGHLGQVRELLNEISVLHGFVHASIIDYDVTSESSVFWNILRIQAGGDVPNN